MDSPNQSKPRDRESIREFKKRMMEQKHSLASPRDPEMLKDEYENSNNCNLLVRKQTGIIYSDRFALHKCEWDSNYPENPDRYLCIIDRLKELNLIEQCREINLDVYDVNTALLVHSKQHIEKLKKFCTEYEVHEAEANSSYYDAIYYNKDTYDCAVLSLSATISLVEAIMKDEIQNGMAIIRPPGHHAQYNEYNGYCFFNNVAIAAKYLRQKHDVDKILIVDFDVHHGQGTQQAFYNDKNVLYFSIHRYENGLFWPNLRESSYDFIGEGEAAGFNINVPLNTTGLGDSDYFAILTHILLPVAYEPNMIIFSAGYDACIGCPEGLMEVSPGFYGHLIKMLSGLANGKLAVILEGGYFLPSLAEGVAMTLRSLLDHAAAFLPPLEKPHQEVIDVIHLLKCYLYDHWKCFKTMEQYSSETSQMIVKYLGTPDPPPYETRNCYPTQTNEEIRRLTEIVEKYKKDYGLPVPNSVCYAYDEEMCLHTIGTEKIETPHRIKVIHERFLELKLDKRCKQLKISDKDVDTLAKRVHSYGYIEQLMSDEFVGKFDSNDMYWNSGKSNISIKKAVSTLISVTEAVVKGTYTSGVAVIRPPGHHAESNCSLGFCFINNVAVAAQHLIDQKLAERVLIIDFDIHHGNGTQNIFYNSSHVLYLSIHKYEYGTFFPKSKNGNESAVGEAEGEGFNVNIPFNTDKMGDVEYVTAFFKVILPIAYQYAPDVVLVSAGFDAGINDLLGNYKVHPETFGHMVQLLKSLAKGRLVLVLEGGYNLNTLKHSMIFCIKTLLGDPLPQLRLETPKQSAYHTFNDVVNIQKKYWKILDVDRPLPKK